MRAASKTVAAALVAFVVAGCGGSDTATETVTVTETNIHTETVTKTVEKSIPAAPTVYVPESGGRLVYKPDVIVTGASGGQIYFDKWLSYGSEEAKARARFEFNDCVPNCAEGTHSFVRATVTLSPIVSCRGTPIYESLRVASSEDESRVSVGEYVDLTGLCREGDSSG